MSSSSPSNEELYVMKRNGETEVLSFDKILQRVKYLGTNQKPTLNVNYSQLVMKIVDQLYNNIPTHVIDELMAEQCASLTTKHLDYGILSSRIIVSNNHKNTTPFFQKQWTLFITIAIFTDYINRLFTKTHGLLVKKIKK